jgi:hypothetical protein
MRTPGMRVGAWLSADDNEVRLLGYGRYVGDEVPPAAGPDAPTGWIACMCREYGHRNPKVLAPGHGFNSERSKQRENGGRP